MLSRTTIRCIASAACVAAFLATPAAMAEDEPTQPRRPVRFGLALQFGTLVLPGAGFSGNHFDVGVKLDRVLLGAGMELYWRLREEGGVDAAPAFQVLGQVAIVRSDDARMEMIGLGAMSIGADPSILEDSGWEATTTTPFIIGRLGAGVQFWALPGLGLSLTTGVAYRSVEFKTSPSQPELLNSTNSSRDTSLFGQLTLTAILGAGAPAREQAREKKAEPRESP